MQLIEAALVDEAATVRLGQALASAINRTAQPNGVISLVGELGAGKSTLARALLRQLGVQGAIKSPTYTLVERYPTGEGECLHLDLYRIADPDELDFLGLDELGLQARLWLIEWPERGGDRLPPIDLQLQLMHAPPGRRFRAEARSPLGAAWVAELAALHRSAL